MYNNSNYWSDVHRFRLSAEDRESGIAYVKWTFTRANGTIIYEEKVPGKQAQVKEGREAERKECGRNKSCMMDGWTATTMMMTFFLVFLVMQRLPRVLRYTNRSDFSVRSVLFCEQLPHDGGKGKPGNRGGHSYHRGHERSGTRQQADHEGSWQPTKRHRDIFHSTSLLLVCKDSSSFIQIPACKSSFLHVII